MEATAINYDRKKLKEGLAQCSYGQQLLFKRMYSHEDLDASIEEVVDRLPEEKLDWALSQVCRTLEKQTPQSVA